MLSLWPLSDFLDSLLLVLCLILTILVIEIKSVSFYSHNVLRCITIHIIYELHFLIELHLAVCAQNTLLAPHLEIISGSAQSSYRVPEIKNELDIGK